MGFLTKEYTFIGSSYLELAQAYMSAVASYDNVTGEGVTVNGTTNAYEYFTMTDSEDDELTYRFCLNAYTSSYTMRAGPATSGQSGGTVSKYYDINSGSSSKYISYGGKMYSHARFFYTTGNKFVGATGLYGVNYNPVTWFAIFHDNLKKPLWCYLEITGSTTGKHKLYDMSQANPTGSLYATFYTEESMSINNETPDTVYMDLQGIIKSNYIDGFLPDVYAIYNNSFFRLINSYKHVNTLLLINTEAGQFMSLRSNTWLKIDGVGKDTTVVFNG